jgi:hypothetical protein
MLVEKAIRFCRDHRYASVFLWTAAGLTAAAALYESVGFQLTEKKTSKVWGAVVRELRFDLQLD